MEPKKPNPIDQHVGARIRMRRLMLNMSQEKLGEALGLTFQQVQKYEKGTNRVGASRLVLIANALHTTVSFLFEGAPGVQSSSSDAAAETMAMQEFIGSADGIAIASALASLPKPTRRAVCDIVEQIVFVHSGSSSARAA